MRLERTILFVCALTLGGSALAGDYDDLLQSLPDDGVVESGWTLQGNIDITSTRTITNRGVLGGYINVCSGCVLTIQNSGTFSAQVSLADKARAIQLIKYAADITNIFSNDITFSVMISGNANLSMSDVLDTVGGVNDFIFENAHITLDDIARMRDIDVEIRGRVIIELPDLSMLGDGVLFNYVTGTGAVSVHSADIDSMFRLHAEIQDDTKLVAKLIRNLDYGTILEDARGRFLNDLREYDPADKLLAKLDAAMSYDELERIMRRSVRLNPINLMRPVELMNLSMKNSAHFDDDTSVVFATPMVIDAGAMRLYGASGGMFGKIGRRASLSVTGYGAGANYSDDINDFSAGVFGANVAAQYDLSLVFVRALAGGSFAIFDSGPVLDGSSVVFNPYGTSVYGFADIGHRFNFPYDIFVSPFVGFGIDAKQILHQSDMDAFGRIGLSAGFSAHSDDIHYDYGMRAHTTTTGNIAMDVYVSAWSVFDEAGIDISVGILRYDDLDGYSVSFGARTKF